MPSRYRQIEVTDTLQFTWIGSSSPASLSLTIRTASYTVVGSVAAVQSAGGNWYAFVTVPDSFGDYPAYLMAEWTATASTHAGNSTRFVSRMVFEVLKTIAFAQGRG